MAFVSVGDIHTASLFRNDRIYNVASIQVPPRPPQSSQSPWMWSLHWLHVFPITHQLQAIIRGEGDPAKYYFEELHLTIEPSNPFGGCVGRNCHHVSWYTALCKRRDPASIVPEALCNSYLQLELGHSPTRIPQWPMIYLFSHLVKGGGGAASDVYVGLRSKCGLWTSLPDPGASTRRMAFRHSNIHLDVCLRRGTDPNFFPISTHAQGTSESKTMFCIITPSPPYRPKHNTRKTDVRYSIYLHTISIRPISGCLYDRDRTQIPISCRIRSCE